MSAREAAPALERVRARLFALHGTLHTAVVALLKHRPAHAPMLAWLTAAVSLNAPRATMRPAWQTLATHGFALNVAAVLARLAEPIKVAAVDANYVVVNGDGFECGAAQTRLVYTDKQLAARAAELQARADKTEPSFHTRVFWLAARAAGVGWRPAAQMFSNMQSALVRVLRCAVQSCACYAVRVMLCVCYAVRYAVLCNAVRAVLNVSQVSLYRLSLRAR